MEAKWSRFTERARRSLFFAQEEARLRGSTKINSNHLFLGLMRENDHRLAELLNALDKPTKTLYKIFAAPPPGKELPAGTPLTWHPSAEQVLQLASSEAQAEKCVFIETYHLFLGVLQLDMYKAAQQCATLNLTYTDFKRVVRQAPLRRQLTSANREQVLRRAVRLIQELEPELFYLSTTELRARLLQLADPEPEGAL